MTRKPSSWLAATLALAGCATADAPLAGYPGTRSQVTSYYDSRAMEMNAACTNPRIDTITEARVVGETAEQVRMDVATTGPTTAASASSATAAACCCAATSPAGPSPSRATATR